MAVIPAGLLGVQPSKQKNGEFMHPFSGQDNDGRVPSSNVVNGAIGGLTGFFRETVKKQCGTARGHPFEGWPWKRGWGGRRRACRRQGGEDQGDRVPGLGRAAEGLPPGRDEPIKKFDGGSGFHGKRGCKVGGIGLDPSRIACCPTFKTKKWRVRAPIFRPR